MAKSCWAIFLALLLFPWMRLGASPMSDLERMQHVPHIDQLIVQLKPHARLPDNQRLTPEQAARIAAYTKVPLKYDRVWSQHFQIFTLPRKVVPARAWAIAKELEKNPDVESVAPNVWGFAARPPNAQKRENH
jgi:hypothetical protein